MPEVLLTAGTLPQPYDTCLYPDEQARLEGFVAAILAEISGALQWQSSVEEPDDLELYWLKLDADGRQVATLKWSVEDARWLRWENLPATDGAVAGTADVITLAFSPSFSAATAYENGRQYIFIAEADNTGPVTINIDGVGAVALTKYGGQPLVAGDIQQDQLLVVVTDGISAQLVNPTIAAPEAQFLTFVGAEESIPATGQTVTVPHGFLNGVLGIQPFMVEVRIVRSAVGSETFTFTDGGSLTINEDQECDPAQFWSGFRGDDNEEYFPVFLIRADTANVYITCHYPNGISIFEDVHPTVPVGAFGQSITPADYKIKVKALALNPNF